MNYTRLEKKKRTRIILLFILWKSSTVFLSSFYYFIFFQDDRQSHFAVKEMREYIIHNIFTVVYIIIKIQTTNGYGGKKEKSISVLSPRLEESARTQTHNTRVVYIFLNFGLFWYIYLGIRGRILWSSIPFGTRYLCRRDTEK